MCDCKIYLTIGGLIVYGVNPDGLRKRVTYEETINYLTTSQEIIRYPSREWKMRRESPWFTQLDADANDDYDGRVVDAQLLVDVNRTRAAMAGISASMGRASGIWRGFGPGPDRPHGGDAARLVSVENHRPRGIGQPQLPMAPMPPRPPKISIKVPVPVPVGISTAVHVPAAFGVTTPLGITTPFGVAAETGQAAILMRGVVSDQTSSVAHEVQTAHGWIPTVLGVVGQGR